MAAVGEIEPSAAARREHAERRAKTAQPFQPDRAVQRQAAGELRDLATVLIGRSKGFFGERCAVVGAKQFCAGRIGPQRNNTLRTATIV